MTKFPGWFKREYKRWNRSQPGEEDFLAFCDFLGYPPATVLSWFQGDSVPNGAQLLSIAGLFGTKIYLLLGQPEPDPELINIYNSFARLKGEYRANLAQAIWEAQMEMGQKGLTASSEEAKLILSKAFKKWGFDDSAKN
jgi:hypothetical protein